MYASGAALEGVGGSCQRRPGSQAVECLQLLTCHKYRATSLLWFACAQPAPCCPSAKRRACSGIRGGEGGVAEALSCRRPAQQL